MWRAIAISIAVQCATALFHAPLPLARRNLRATEDRELQKMLHDEAGNLIDAALPVDLDNMLSDWIPQQKISQLERAKRQERLLAEQTDALAQKMSAAQAKLKYTRSHMPTSDQLHNLHEKVKQLQDQLTIMQGQASEAKATVSRLSALPGEA